MEIVPVFLEMVDTHTDGMTQAERFPFFAKLYKRLGEGMRKYGRPLTTDNGRDSLMDAWEEACDGSQYLLQAYCEGKLPDAELVHAQISLMMAIERWITIDGRTQAHIEARGGQAEADAIHDTSDDPF
jgi:hypothetical protein